MRSHHVIAVVVVLLVGLGVKMFLFPTPAAEAQAPDASMDIFQMHLNHPHIKHLPEQRIEKPSEFF